MLKATCPSCGAPVEFKSAVSILSICESCRSTLVRHDVNLENIGKMAELKLDGSPIQLGVEGRYLDVHFVVIGRIQLRFEQGIWNEWHLLFDDGRSGWLGEAQGTYAVSFLAKNSAAFPEFSALAPGEKVELRGQGFQVQNRESARCIGGEGELPFQVGAGYDAPVVDLLGPNDSFATIDYSEEEPLLFIGEYMEFDDLHFSNLRQFDGWSKQAPPKVKTFRCLQCGAAVTLRGLLQTTSVVCSSCGAIIDVSDENLKIISTFVSKAKVEPAIPLGSRGTFHDGVFEVIGFMRRVINVEGTDYRWREYLLFNPFKGFRWLSEYNGHWSYIKTIPRRPQVLRDGSVKLEGTHFQHFQSAQAKVDYVIGEFYWRIQAGETCLVQDFVAPPNILSMEKTENEITCALGEYIEPGELAGAFQLTTPLPARIGVGANQPSPLTPVVPRVLGLTALFIGLALLIQLATMALSDNRLVYETQLRYNTADAEKSRVTDVFELDGRRSSVVVRTAAAGLNNNWIYLSMALINDDTGTAYDFGREIGYYAGNDSDGPWSEGSKYDEVFLPAIPAGHYYLRIEPEGSASTPYAVSVYRDVPRWWPFLVAVGLFLLFPIAVLWRRHSFEYQRWSESDHPMTKFTSSGDDE
jgi:Domain of unknown function (DUF4178)